jgi:hypothetical protein
VHCQISPGLQGELRLCLLSRTAIVEPWISQSRSPEPTVELSPFLKNNLTLSTPFYEHHDLNLVCHGFFLNSVIIPSFTPPIPVERRQIEALTAVVISVKGILLII